MVYETVVSNIVINIVSATLTLSWLLKSFKHNIQSDCMIMLMYKQTDINILTLAHSAYTYINISIIIYLFMRKNIISMLNLDNCIKK